MSYDSQNAFLIRLLRARAHIASARENPRVSKEAVILNDCAERLEALYASPLSEFDKLMKR